MRENLEELNSRGLAEHPGAARRRRAHPHATSSATCARSTRAALFYGKDAFEGLRTHGPARCEIKRGAATTTPTSAASRRAARPAAAQVAAERRRSTASTVPARSPDVATDNPVFAPPFLGSQVVKGIAARRHRRLPQRDRAVPQPVAVPAREAARPTTSSRPASGPMLRERARQGQGRRTCSCPQVVYGYFPVNGDGDDLVVWTDETRTAERLRFSLPPPDARSRSSASPTSSARSTSGEADYAAFHIVTMGAAVSRAHGRAVRRRPLPGVPAAPRPRRRDGRGAGRAAGTAASARSGASPTRTARRSPACSASSTAAAATRGATRRAPTSRTT